MNLVIKIYELIFYRPILNFLIFLHYTLKDFGLAVIVLTLFFRLFLSPFDIYSMKMQKKLTEFQKEVKQIEKKYNGEEKLKRIISLRKEKRINPFFSFFSFLIQLPILIALYQVFLKGAKETQLNPVSFGFLDLSKPNFIFAILVSLFQFSYSSYFSKNESSQSFFQSQISLLLSIFTFIILLKLPSAIGIYLIFNFLFLILLRKIFHV